MNSTVNSKERGEKGIKGVMNKWNESTRWMDEGEVKSVNRWKAMNGM
jgi:hypothetical protein